MSDMKCPVCKTGNVEQGKYDKEYFCNNEFCPSYDETDSRTYDILIHTRKALETIRLHLMTAKGRFNFYDEYLVSGIDSPDARFIKEEIDKALEQIKAPEQKDVK